MKVVPRYELTRAVVSLVASKNISQKTFNSYLKVVYPKLWKNVLRYYHEKAIYALCCTAWRGDVYNSKRFCILIKRIDRSCYQLNPLWKRLFSNEQLFFISSDQYPRRLSLLCAARRGHLDVIKYLWKKSGILTKRSSLCLASIICANNHPEVVEYLVELGFKTWGVHFGVRMYDWAKQSKEMRRWCQRLQIHHKIDTYNAAPECCVS